MGTPEPWSKKHKRVTNASSGGVPFSLSNSYAQPLTHPELIALSQARGDVELVDAYNTHALGYTPNGGSLDLREEIANLYGTSITSDNVLVFAGAQVALQTAAIALASDAHSIVFTPGYQSTVEAPGHAGGRVTQIKLRASNSWHPDPKEVEAAIREDTRYMVINEPYNPAGTLMSHHLQLELISIAERHGIHIMSDEVYRLLEHDSKDRLPAMADLYEKGISAVTLSKPWGGCGVTIGWLAFQDLGIKQKLVDAQYFGTGETERWGEKTEEKPLIQPPPLIPPLIHSTTHSTTQRARVGRASSRRSWHCAQVTPSWKRTWQSFVEIWPY
jgi:DNA-binding transcriptional MocR family regulator